MKNEKSKMRGVRMAIKVAALSVGATAAVMAATATDATAETATQEAPAPEPLRLEGWSCLSRGPLAPPSIPVDFADLYAEVPA